MSTQPSCSTTATNQLPWLELGMSGHAASALDYYSAVLNKLKWSVRRWRRPPWAGAAFGDGCAQWPALVMGAVLEMVRLTLEGDEVSARLGAMLGHGQRSERKMGNGWR